MTELEIMKETLKMIRYDESSGLFHWIVEKPKGRKGDGITVHLCKFEEGYLNFCYKNNFVGGHRLAWFHFYGSAPNGQIDHINGNRSDNRIKNIREVSVRENAMNRKYHREGQLPYAHKRTTGKYTYFAAVVKGKHLGNFKTRDEAHAHSMNQIQIGGS